MNFMMIGLGLIFLPALLQLALRLRLGVPTAYAAIVPTVFRSWYLVSTALADGIFFVLVGLVLLSWMITFVRKLLTVLT